MIDTLSVELPSGRWRRSWVNPPMSIFPRDGARSSPHFPKCRHSMSVTPRHGVGERAGAIGPAWHARLGTPARASSESPRNHRGHRCPITSHNGHFKRGPTYGTGFLGSEGGFRGFRSRARERYTTLLPPSGASRVRLGHAIAVAAIVLEPLLDQPGKLVELRSAHRRCASVARRHRKLKHLPHALA